MIESIYFILLLISNVSSYNVPLYRNWNCIGVEKYIDTSKPFSFNVGDIPLVAWKNNNTYSSTLNICKHFGSKLDDGWIDNNCLVCPYHGYKHGANDICGTVVSFDEKLWWSYDPINKTPYKLPDVFDDFNTQYIETVMDESLPLCIYNSMDINHAEYIHGDIFGFGSENPVKSYDHFNINDNNIISTNFKYHIKNNIRLISNINIDSIEHNTNNYHEFIYPSTTWSLVENSHNDNKLIIHVDMCPIEKYKTKWIITIKNNYMNKILSKYLLKFITNLILTQDNNQFKKQCKNDLLRSKYLLQNKLKYENHIEDIHNKFKTYKYPELDDFLSYCERLKIR
jgi:phenylpropionate dioxygenase-like ring-hydroxylating dioxygenase large terminal subunit